MVKRQQLSLVLYLATAIIIVILLSAGLSELDLQTGKPLNLLGLLLEKLRPGDTAAPVSSDEGGPSLRWLGPVFWVLLVFSIAYAIVSPRFRTQLLRTFILVLMLLVLFNSLANRLEREGVESEGQAGAFAGEPADFGIPDPPSFVTDPPGWLLAAVNVLLVLLVLGTVWFLWRLFRPKPDTQALLIREAEGALADLEAGGDLRNVVLRCYAEMSRILRQSRNITRRRAMTPREFEEHLADLGLRDEHIQRLTHLFEGARYGARPTGGRAEREAMDCLRAIVRAYGETI